MKEDILSESEKLQEELVRHRRFIHSNPEIGLDLPETTAYVKKQLKGMGYEPVEICQSGIVVVAGGKKPGKTVLLRADMDALPIEEASEEPFSSTNGKMHACGHDMHTAMLLGAAKLLKSREDEIEGMVKLMFQPGEEILQGASSMIDAGVLDNPKVDMAMMLHVGTGMPLPDGTLTMAREGSFSASSDTFRITVKGKGGHGAMPETAVDPMVPAANILLGLQAINSREISSSEAVVLTVGKFQGGSAANIIPENVLLEGTIRSFSNENRTFIKKRLEEISSDIARAYRCEADIEFRNGCPSVVIDGNGAETFNHAVKEILGDSSLIPLDSLIPGGKIAGSEDFAFVTEKVPGVMALLATGNATEGYVFPPHHPKARFSEGPLHKGAAVYAGFALEWLKKANR